MNTKRIAHLFLLFGLSSLALALIFGLLGAIQYLHPRFLKEIPFYKARPLHVSLAVAWIFLTVLGGIYLYIKTYFKEWYSKFLSGLHLFIFIITGITIILFYLTGKFGGREYWEFPPYLSIPIIISWVLFGFNYFKTVLSIKDWPVYLWMWATGIVFFFFTYAESNLWIFDYFSDNPVREITVQWKSYGALVGSWNMLVYGTAIFLMEKISGDVSYARSKTGFLLYFLGFTNLLFGWAHHTYIVPSALWIRHLAYIISMTEFIILFKMLWQWKNTLTAYRKAQNNLAYKFLVSTDIWVFLNLLLALAISIPGINFFTHGTHITVAHAMGSTIGINTTILLASLFFINQETLNTKLLTKLFWIFHFSLLVFWLALIVAGAKKGLAQVFTNFTFQEIKFLIKPYFVLFALSGAGIVISLLGFISVLFDKLLIQYHKIK